jgi:hypothetical protein
MNFLILNKNKKKTKLNNNRKRASNNFNSRSKKLYRKLKKNRKIINKIFKANHS